MREQPIRFCPHCGIAVETREFAGKERPVCPQCDWVYFPDPKVAAGVLVIQDDKVLLVRRVMKPQRGYWGIPAGFVDAFEDPARAAERECLEETGLEVNAGDSFTVILCSNPTTGFIWSEAAEISDQTVIQQTDHKFVPPQGEGEPSASGTSGQGKGNGNGAPPASGTPGQEIWTFKALKEGTSTVSLEYSQPWDGGEKGEWTYVLTITVK